MSGFSSRAQTIGFISFPLYFAFCFLLSPLYVQLHYVRYQSHLRIILLIDSSCHLDFITAVMNRQSPNQSTGASTAGEYP